MRHESAVVVHVSNNVYDLSPRPGFGTRPTLADGQLGVVVLTAGTVGAVVRPLQWATPEFVVDSSGPVPVGIDGEAVVLDAPVRFTVRPGVLRVRIPRSSSGRSPAAARLGLVRRTAGRVRVLFAPIP